MIQNILIKIPNKVIETRWDKDLVIDMIMIVIDSENGPNLDQKTQNILHLNNQDIEANLLKIVTNLLKKTRIQNALKKCSRNLIKIHQENNKDHQENNQDQNL